MLDEFDLYGYCDYNKAEIGRSIDVPKNRPVWVEISSDPNPQDIWDYYKAGWDLHPFGPRPAPHIALGGVSKPMHFDRFLLTFDLQMQAYRNGRHLA